MIKKYLQQYPAVVTDAIAIAVGAIGVYVVTSYVVRSSQIDDFFSQHTNRQIDELFLVSAFLTIGFIAFFWRRWREVGQSLSERERALAELQVAKDTADAANRAKGEFLANMSHEIRTPMNAIIGMTELTLGTELSSEQRDNLQLVQTSAQSLLQILNDILDFSKIEAGKLELVPASFSLRTVLGDVIKSFGPRAREKGLAISWRDAGNTPDRLIGDPLRFRQILVNLIGNAIKFTDVGEVVVIIESELVDDDGVRLHVSVRDTGIGIPPDMVQRVFEAFTQAEGGSKRQFGGTGLGLTISTRLVHMMGGHIRVESVVGEGSTFHFTANFRLNRAAAPDPQSAPHTEGEEVAAASSELHAAKHDPTSSAGDQATPAVQLNILLAEDNPVNQRVAIAGLEKRGHVVTAVNNGKEAIHALKCEHFDLVLMDVQMPEMDGFEATRAIRLSEHETGQHIPIIAMTAHAMKGDREQCLQSGMDDYIAKPVDPKALAQLIFHWVPPERQSEHSREVAASDAGRHSTNHDQIPAASQTRRATPAVDVDVFDLAALEARVEDDQELLAEMIELHLNNSPQLLVEIESAVTMHHGGNLVRSGHTLKGVLKNMCAARSAQAAQKVEAIGSSGKWDLADSALADLTSELELLRLALTDVQQGIHA